MRNPRRLSILVLLAAGCAFVAPPRVFVHPEYTDRRPAMLALEVKAPDPVREGLIEAVYDALIAKNYTVQVPGEPAGPDAGIARVVIAAGEPELTGALSIFDTRNARLFRSDAKGKTPEELVDRLVKALPAK